MRRIHEATVGDGSRLLQAKLLNVVQPVPFGRVRQGRLEAFAHMGKHGLCGGKFRRLGSGDFRRIRPSAGGNDSRVWIARSGMRLAGRNCCHHGPAARNAAHGHVMRCCPAAARSHCSHQGPWFLTQGQAATWTGGGATVGVTVTVGEVTLAADTPLPWL